MKIELNWQKRAVIVLACSLVVLSIILAVFAIREADRERLLKDKETAEDQRRLADSVAALAKSYLSEMEQRIEGLLRLYRDDIGSEKFAETARAAAANEDLIDEIFLLDDKKNLTVFNGKPLYALSGDESPGRDVSTGSDPGGLWKQAETAEFKTRAYSEAIQLYQKLWTSNRDQDVRALILSRIGRCREKSGNRTRAIEAYRTLLETSPPDLVSEGIPLAVIAWHQIEKIHRDSGRNAEAAEAILRFRTGLLDGGWPLTKARFDFYKKDSEERFRALIEDFDAADSGMNIRERWEKLGILEKSRMERMGLLEAVSQRIVPQIELKRYDGRNETGTFDHVSDSADGRLLLVSSIDLEERLTCLLLLNPGALAGKLIPSGPEELRLREGRHLRITDESGGLLAGDDPASDAHPPPHAVLSRGFEDNFPPWTITVLQSNIDSANRQFQLRRSIYILSVGVVIAALFLGGFLAIRSTAKELRLAKLKSDFVSTVSHEFRTPLMSIRYLAELLERGRVDDEERKRQYYAAITSESERLGLLVENILDFSKIEAGLKEYQAEEVDVAGLVADVASRFERQAGLKAFKLETSVADGIPGIVGDKEALSRALFNLLDNSVKYSGDRLSISLRAWPDGTTVYLEVEDNGIGIAKDEQRKIFDKFYRSDRALQGNVKGSGIGLTLVDRIVRAHAGKVTLESEPGKGTRVTIRIPVPPPADNSGKGEIGNGSNSHR